MLFSANPSRVSKYVIICIAERLVFASAQDFVAAAQG